MEMVPKCGESYRWRCVQDVITAPAAKYLLKAAKMEVEKFRIFDQILLQSERILASFQTCPIPRKQQM